MFASSTDAAQRATIVIPVYNDWEAAIALLRRLEQVLAGASRSADVLIVDDGSTDPLPESSLPSDVGLGTVTILRLRGNLGHQRAIAVGLAHLHAAGGAGPIIVMDGDGEDDPNDVPRLLDRFEAGAGRKLVFALRLRRSEGVVFTFFYHLYRALHRVLTGISVRFGNFSVIPREALDRLVVSPDLWNHYAASVLRARIPIEGVPTARARRFAGRSKMNFIGQVSHGLSALSVFGELIGVRMLVSCFVLFVLFLVLIGAGAIAVPASGLELPLWAGLGAALLLILLVQTLLWAVAATLLVLHSRGRSTFLPIRDHVHFVAGTRIVRE